MRRLNMARSRRSAFVVAIVLVALLCAHGASADTAFGRNKVQYRSFDWRIIHTEHFDVYFYEGGEDIADAASQIIEDANADFEVLLGHELTAIIPIILYNSHNEFQQTNVSLSHVEETVGGFTELFKNRVVIPFTGSYDDLRHVLYHELTHVFMFDIVYGGLVESVIRQAYTNPVPLWFVEGLAEYTSMGWDPEAEMILRDLTVSDLVVPLEYLYGGYLVYKGGQSVLNFIAERYGREKIAEIVKAIAKTHNLDAALRETIGLMTPELSEEWHEWLQEKYWPEVTERDDGDRLATFVTDHREDDSYFNFGPAISPDGKKVVFVSDRNRTANVFVSSTLDGRTLHHVVSGEVTDEFEALHILRTGFAWSPDASQICFATKAGRSDALHFADAESGDIVASHRYDLDGIFTPSWSPDGRSIVFVGLKNGASDLYLTDVDGAEPRQLTDDFFDERDPEWSPDGSKVAFSSDRDSPPEMGFRRDYDIYSMDIETLEVTRLVATPGRDGSPAWAHHGELMAYGSDMHGSPAIYMADLETGLSVLATDLLGGAKAPSWAREADWAAFQLYSEGGWDIAVVKNPLSRFEEVIDENGWFPSIKQEVPDEPTRPDVEVIAEADFIGPSPAPAGAAAVGAAAVAVAEGPPLGGNPSGHAGAGNGNGNGNGKLFAGQTAAEERNGGASEGTGEPERVYGGEGPHEDPDALDGDRFESGGEATSDASDESAPGSSEQYADGSDYDDDRDDDAVAKAREAYAKASGVHTPGADMEDEPRDLGKIEPYRPRFAPDYVTGGLAYTSSFGFSAGAEIAISDVLGNHRFYIAADLFTSIEASNLYVRYENLSHRFNYSIGLYNFTENYYSDRTQLGEYLGKRRYFTERSFGATASLEYPFSKFTRIEFDLAAMSDRVRPRGDVDRQEVPGRERRGLHRADRGTGEKAAPHPERPARQRHDALGFRRARRRGQVLDLPLEGLGSRRELRLPLGGRRHQEVREDRAGAHACAEVPRGAQLVPERPVLLHGRRQRPQGVRGLPVPGPQSHPHQHRAEVPPASPSRDRITASPGAVERAWRGVSRRRRGVGREVPGRLEWGSGTAARRHHGRLRVRRPHKPRLFRPAVRLGVAEQRQDERTDADALRDGRGVLERSPDSDAPGFGPSIRTGSRPDRPPRESRARSPDVLLFPGRPPGRRPPPDDDRRSQTGDGLSQ